MDGLIKMETLVKVGMADLKAASHPAVLTTLGLGSCVGVALYDKYNNVVGLVHAMLPYREEIRNNFNHAKFVDSGIEKLLCEMEKLGAKKINIVAKIAGGAQMFEYIQSDIVRIGQRNIAASKAKLQELKIPITGEDTGGSFGRTIELYSNTGRLLIKTIENGIKEI